MNEDTIGNKLIDKALVFYSKEKLDSSFYYFNQAKLKSQNQDNIVYSLIRMANIQLSTSDFAGSETTITEALKINKDKKNYTSIYNTLGLVNLEQFDFSNSLKYYSESLNVAEKESEKNTIKNNIGYLFLKSEHYQKTIKTLQPLLKKDSLKIDAENYARVLDNLGFAYFKTNNPIAIDYLNQSLKIRDSINDNFSKVSSYIHLSEYYQDKNNSTAITFGIKAYELATALNSPDDRIEALKFLLNSSNIDDAKQIAILQIKISDSINKERKLARNEFAKIKYDSKKANEESAKHKFQKELLIFILIILIITSSFLYYIIKLNNKKELQNNTYKTETRISKKLHDELANDVFNVMSFAETLHLNDETKKELLVNNLDDIYLRTRNIARENSDIHTGIQFQENLISMISSFISNDISVVTKNPSAINWEKISKNSKITIYRIIQELMINMKKHSQCSVVVISFISNINSFEINYSDNGIGTSNMLKFKNGLQNAENRIIAINGTLTFETESGKGFKANLTCPI